MKIIWSICLGSLIVFGIIHAISVMVLGMTIQEVAQLHIGLILFSGVMIVFSGNWHRISVAEMVVFFFIVAVSGVISFSYSHNLWAALAATACYLALLSLLQYIVNIGEPKRRHRAPLSKPHPRFGEVMIDEDYTT